MWKKWFGFNPQTMKIHTEVMAGITSFLAMAYILAVNPAILSATGMDKISARGKKDKISLFMISQISWELMVPLKESGTNIILFIKFPLLAILGQHPAGSTHFLSFCSA